MNRLLLRRAGIVISLTAAVTLGAVTAQAAPSAKAVGILDGVRPAASTELPPHAKANSGISGMLNARAMDASAVELTLADGRKVTARLERVAKDDQKRTQSWIGTFGDEPGSLLVLTKVSGTVSGFATYGSETFEVKPISGGRHLLYQVDPARLPDLEPSGTGFHAEAGDTFTTSTSDLSGGTAFATGNAVVHDVLLVYTRNSASVSGSATLEGMIQSAVQSANQAYLNSQVNITLNVVGLQQVSMTESSGMSATLSALEKDPEVQSLRDKLAADMIVLVSENYDYCGIASVWISWGSWGTETDANSVVSSRCLSGHVLAHEVGHMQRLDHDRASAGGGLAAYEYSYGYKFCTSAGFRDIMSYACSPDVPRLVQFSNPRLYYNGYPTGIAYETNPSQAADAARSLNDNATAVAAYRVGTSSSVVSTAPASPSGLAAASVAYNGVTLVWSDNATNESGYKVERSPDGVTFSEVASLGVDARGFSDAGVSVSSNYFYRVRAFNSVGFSGYSNTVAVTTPASPPPPPPAPTSVAASDGGSGSALVTWTTDSSAPTGFEVWRETWDARKKVWGRLTLASTVPASMRSVVDATNNGTYRYFVQAVNSGGSSSKAGPAAVTVSSGTKGGGRYK